MKKRKKSCIWKKAIQLWIHPAMFVVAVNWHWALAMWIRRNFITHYIIIHYGRIEIRTKSTYYLNILLILLHLFAHRTSLKKHLISWHTNKQTNAYRHIRMNDKKIHWGRKPIPSNYIVWVCAIVSMMLLFTNKTNFKLNHKTKSCLLKPSNRLAYEYNYYQVISSSKLNKHFLHEHCEKMVSDICLATMCSNCIPLQYQYHFDYVGSWNWNSAEWKNHTSRVLLCLCENVRTPWNSSDYQMLNYGK